MKVHVPHVKGTLHNAPKLVLLVIPTLILLTIIPLYLSQYPSLLSYYLEESTVTRLPKEESTETRVSKEEPTETTVSTGDSIETRVSKEEPTETRVSKGESIETRVSKEESTETRVSKEDSIETRVPKEDQTEARVSKEESTETRVSKEDSIETRVPKEDQTEARVSKEESTETGVLKGESTGTRVRKEESTETEVSKGESPGTRVWKEEPRETKGLKECDIFSGEWVPYPDGPYYTNTSCLQIHEHTNCFKYGRPDTDFLKWRWKPDGCELPRFNPVQFLEIVKGKSMAFVGDSVARNHMQSLMCLLSSVGHPADVSYTLDDKFKRWFYNDYNFTIASFWSPHLIKTKEAKPKGPLVPQFNNLYLDEFDEAWTTQIDEFDYVIISAVQWFWAPALFYENGQLVGCHMCFDKNITDLTMYYGYRKAFRTAFRAINGLKNFKGMTFLRTLSPGHFENGEWNKGGSCARTRPFTSKERRVEGPELEFYSTQVEEFETAEREGMKRGLKFRLLDATRAMVLRPDGHPGRYRHWPDQSLNLSDCTHWCLPGPVDTWNEFLLHMLKMEED